MMTKFCRLLISACMALLAGCAAVERIPQPEGRHLSPAEVRAVMARVQKRTESVRDFKALVGVQAETSLQSHSSRFALSMRRPAQVRLEFFPTTSFYVLRRTIIAGDQYETTDLVSQEKQRGSASSETMDQLLGIAIEPAVLPEFILAGLPAGRYSGLELFDGSIALLSEDRRFYAVIPPQSDAVSSLRVFDEDGRKVLGAVYSNRDPSSAAALPQTVTVDVPKQGATINLSVRNAKINTGIDSSIFQLATISD